MSGFSTNAFSQVSFDPNAFSFGTPSLFQPAFSDTAFSKLSFADNAFSFGAGSITPDDGFDVYVVEYRRRRR